MTFLITGAGAPGWYSIYTSVREYFPHKKIIATDMNKNSYGKLFADAFYQVPRGDNKNYLIPMKRIVEKDSIDLIIPITDPELIPLSEFKKCKVMVSDTRTLQKISKKELYLTFSDYAPEYIITNSIKDIRMFAETFSGCFIKPIESYGSRGIKHIVKDDIYKKYYWDYKPSIVGKLTTFKILEENWNNTKEYIVMEYLPNMEYSVDCLFNRDGFPMFIIPRRRDEIKLGICYKTTTVENNELINIVREMSQKIKLKYVINIQFKQNIDGKYKLLEINPRISGSIMADKIAGVDLVMLGTQLALDKEVNAENIKVLWNKTSYRYTSMIG